MATIPIAIEKYKIVCWFSASRAPSHSTTVVNEPDM
jgi:hypothetical protein